MDFNSPDTIKMLKEKRKFHQEQLRLIEIALAALEAGKGIRDETGASERALAEKVRKHRIQWTREIGEILDDYDEFTTIDLQNDLAQKRGIAQALSMQGRNVITNALNRFIKKGRVQLIRPGVYQVVK